MASSGIVFVSLNIKNCVLQIRSKKSKYLQYETFLTDTYKCRVLENIYDILQGRNSVFSWDDK
jgi:hypothetical protein